MTIKKGSLKQQLDSLWEGNKSVKVLPTKEEKYVIISDMHMGNGEYADDFKHNKNAVLRAFKHYKDNGYSLILLGDIEELWQFTSDEIAYEYNDSVYKAIRAFGDEKKVFRVFGNHDIDWKTQDPIRSKPSLVYPVYEAIKLKDSKRKPKILLIHGHQGTKDSDKYSFISRAAVMGYRYFERYFKIDKPTDAPLSIISGEFERDRYRWAMDKKIILICGHTHRAVFESKSKIDINKEKISEINSELLNDAVIGPNMFDKQLKIEKLKEEIAYEVKHGREYTSLGQQPAPHYFNTGCALYTNGITVIEIANDTIKLVKWHRKITGRNMFSIYGQANLSDIISRLG